MAHFALVRGEGSQIMRMLIVTLSAALMFNGR
jgi:hypothetical protein